MSNGEPGKPNKKESTGVYEIVFVTSMVMVLMTPLWWVTGFMALGLPSIKHGDGFHHPIGGFPMACHGDEVLAPLLG